MTTLADLDRMAASRPWGAKLPTAGLTAPSCPLCGRRGRVLEAWANIRHKAVLNCVCEGCRGMGSPVNYHWNHWNGEGGDIQRTLDDWMVGA